METIRGRFPDKNNVLRLFFAVAFPVHVWAIIVTLQRIPTYLLYLKISEIAGIVSYTLAFVFFENIIITFVVLLLGAVLPSRFWKDGIVARAAILVPIALGIAFLVQSFDYEFFFRYQVYIPFKYWLMIWALGLIPILMVNYLVGKYRKLSDLLSNYVDRITVLSQFYVFIDLVAMVLIIWRNISPSR